MKKTMDKREIAKFHKYLGLEVKLQDISKSMGILPDTLKKFTPEALVEAQKLADEQKAQTDKARAGLIADALKIAASKAVQEK